MLADASWTGVSTFSFLFLVGRALEEHVGSKKGTAGAVKRMGGGTVGLDNGAGETVAGTEDGMGKTTVGLDDRVAKMTIGLDNRAGNTMARMDGRAAEMMTMFENGTPPWSIAEAKSADPRTGDRGGKGVGVVHSLRGDTGGNRVGDPWCDGSCDDASRQGESKGRL